MKKTVLCFGDSNTWGYIPGGDCDRYAPDVRWPGVMQAALGTDDFTIIEEAPPNDFFTNPQIERGKSFLQSILTH